MTGRPVEDGGYLLTAKQELAVLLQATGLSFREAAVYCDVTHTAMRRRYNRAVAKSGARGAVELQALVVLGRIRIRPESRKVIKRIIADSNVPFPTGNEFQIGT